MRETTLTLLCCLLACLTSSLLHQPFKFQSTSNVYFNHLSSQLELASSTKQSIVSTKPELSKSWSKPRNNYSNNSKERYTFDSNRNPNNNKQRIQYNNPKRQKLEDYIARLQALNLSEGNSEEFTSTLKHLAANIEVLSNSSRSSKDVVNIIQAIFDKFRPNIWYILRNNIADLIWSCGKLGFKIHKQRETCYSLLKAFIDAERGYDAYALAKSLIGLCKVGIKLSHMSLEDRQQFFRVVLNISNIIDDRGIANTVYSLAVMNTSVNDLPVGVSSFLLSSVEDNILLMNPQGVANTIYSLGVIGYQWSSLSSGLRNRIETKLPNSLANMTSQGLANTYYGLGSMKFPFFLTDSNLRKSILMNQESKISNMSTVGISSSLYGLAFMGVSWHDWKEGTADRLELAIASSIRLMDQRALASVICSLGKLEVKWLELNPDTKIMLIERVVALVLSMSPQEVSSLCYGFSSMNARWRLWSVNTQGRLMKAIEMTVKDMDCQDFGKLIYG